MHTMATERMSAAQGTPGGGGGGGGGGDDGGGGGGGRRRKEKGLKDDLVRIVYGYGDEKEPAKASIELLEGMVHEYVGEMCRQAYEVALLGQREVQTGDLIFLIRKDVRRYKRMKDLLEADAELREARDPKVKKITDAET